MLIPVSNVMSQPLDSYWPIVEPLFGEISIDDPETFATSSRLVQRPALLLFAAHFTLSELWNGGFLQFFFNSTGLLAPEAIQGFKAIGMPELAQVITTAARPLGNPYPRAREDRWDALLVGSGLDRAELTAIFEQAPSQYVAFAKATTSLDFDRLTDLVYELAETESGGFQTAATNYANLTARSII